MLEDIFPSPVRRGARGEVIKSINLKSKTEASSNFQKS